jgi:hypothetical protein
MPMTVEKREGSALVRRTVVSFCWVLAVLMPACASPSRLSAPDPQAQAVADAFARAWIEDGLDGVKPYLSSSGPAGEFIERDHEFFVTHKFVIIGRARFDERVGFLSGPGYEVAAIGLEGQRNLDDADLIEWTIGIELIRENDSWKVAGLTTQQGRLRVRALGCIDDTVPCIRP